MIQIRSSVFETNSSSVHSICISKKKPVRIPKEMEFHLGEYGWESGCPDRADYLYTAACCLEHGAFLITLKVVLAELGVHASFEDPKEKRSLWGNNYYNDFGIDHAYELGAMLDAFVADHNLLIRYLFSDASVVYTGNDNGDCCPNHADAYTYEYDDDTGNYVKTPNPNHHPNDFDYFEKGN